MCVNSPAATLGQRRLDIRASSSPSHHAVPPSVSFILPACLPAIIITTARTVLGTRPDLGPELIDAAKKQDGLADIQPLIDQGAPVDFQVTS